MWIPEEAWISIDDPGYRKSRRDVEEWIGCDLARVTDRVALAPYAEAICSVVGFFAYPDPSSMLGGVRTVELPQVRSKHLDEYRQAIVSIGPDTDTTVLAASSRSGVEYGVFRLTWKRYAEVLFPVASCLIAEDFSWIFLDYEGEFATSGKPMPGGVRRIARVGKYMTPTGQLVSKDRFVILHGDDNRWESGRLGFGADLASTEAFARAMSWATGLPIEQHDLDPWDPRQQG